MTLKFKLLMSHSDRNYSESFKNNMNFYLNKLTYFGKVLEKIT